MNTDFYNRWTLIVTQTNTIAGRASKVPKTKKLFDLWFSCSVAVARDLKLSFLKDTRPSAADPSEHIWVAPLLPPPSCLQLPSSLKQPAIPSSQKVSQNSSLKQPAIAISQQITLPASLKQPAIASSEQITLPASLKQPAIASSQQITVKNPPWNSQ